MDILKKCEERYRKRFFAELIGVFAQLWTLRLPKASSFIPDPDGGEDPIVGRVFSIALDELQIMHHEQMTPSPFHSATEFIDHRYDILSRRCQLPQQDLSHEDAVSDLLALDGLKDMRSGLANEECERGLFVLAHMDLRCGNIMVDDELRIQAIIDWEWASTVPQQLFAPPAWLTGHDPHYFDDCNNIPSEFHAALQTERHASYGHGELVDHWDPQQKLLPLIQILHCPSDLYDVYYEFIHSSLPDKCTPVLVSETDRGLELAAQEWFDVCERYTRHLKDHSLYYASEMPLLMKQIQIHEERFGSKILM